MLTSLLLLRAQYCFHPSSRTSSKGPEHKKYVIQRGPEEKNYLSNFPRIMLWLWGRKRNRRMRYPLIKALLKRYLSLVRIFFFINYMSSFRKIKVAPYVQGHQIENRSQVPEASCSSVHSMSERHIGEIISKDVTKHCSRKTITKGSQGSFTLILNSFTLHCPQAFQIC